VGQARPTNEPHSWFQSTSNLLFTQLNWDEIHINFLNTSMLPKIIIIHINCAIDKEGQNKKDKGTKIMQNFKKQIITNNNFKEILPEYKKQYFL
jgi:hypothetical protein